MWKLTRSNAVCINFCISWIIFAAFLLLKCTYTVPHMVQKSFKGFVHTFLKTSQLWWVHFASKIKISDWLTHFIIVMKYRQNLMPKSATISSHIFANILFRSIVFPHIIAAATILFWNFQTLKISSLIFPLCNKNLNSFLTDVRKLLRGGKYSREETIWGNRFILGNG